MDAMPIYLYYNASDLCEMVSYQLAKYCTSPTWGKQFSVDNLTRLWLGVNGKGVKKKILND